VFAVKNRLLVSNLPFSATPDGVRAHFGARGHSVSDIDFGPNEKWRLPRGYAVVTLAHNDDVRNAVRDMDGSEFEGRALRVEGAKPLKWRVRSERAA
jgi:RNA recognition motif-containing protein